MFYHLIFVICLVVDFFFFSWMFAGLLCMLLYIGSYDNCWHAISLTRIYGAFNTANST